MMPFEDGLLKLDNTSPCAFKEDKIYSILNGATVGRLGFPTTYWGKIQWEKCRELTSLELIFND